MTGRIREYHRFRRRYLRVNEYCEACGRPAKQIDHIVRRTRRPDLLCETENVRASCGRHGSVDYINGRHTTDEERLREIYRHFGSEAAKYYWEKIRL